LQSWIIKNCFKIQYDICFVVTHGPGIGSRIRWSTRYFGFEDLGEIYLYITQTHTIAMQIKLQITAFQCI
jgi:hypothetical protein